MESLITIISQVGFPIAIAVYVLVRMEHKMDRLKQSILGKDGVLDKIEEIMKRLDRLEK